MINSFVYRKNLMCLNLIDYIDEIIHIYKFHIYKSKFIFLISLIDVGVDDKLKMMQ